MDYLWFRWTLGWNHQLKKTCLLVGWLMTVSGDVCTCCIFSLNWPIRVRESRFVAENQWSDWSPRILKIPLPNQVIKVKYSNIRLQIFKLILSNPNQTFWIFVKPESRFWGANIRFSLHCRNKEIIYRPTSDLTGETLVSSVHFPSQVFSTRPAFFSHNLVRFAH